VPYAWSGADEDLPETGWDFAPGMAFRPEMPQAGETTHQVSSARPQRGFAPSDDVVG
jgi:hypothetical protein